MSALGMANLFAISAAFLVAVVGVALVARHPLPFFAAWARGQVVATLLVALEAAAAQIGHPPALVVTEAALCAAVIWWFIRAERHLVAAPMPAWVLGSCIAIVLATLAGTMAGSKPPVALLPALLPLVGCQVYLSYGLAMAGRRARGARWLAWPLFGHALWALTYPITSLHWWGYAVEGLLMLTTGAGLVTYLVETLAVRLRDQHARELEAVRARIALAAGLERELTLRVSKLQGCLRALPDGDRPVVTAVWAAPLDALRREVDQLADLAEQVQRARTP